MAKHCDGCGAQYEDFAEQCSECKTSDFITVEEWQRQQDELSESQRLALAQEPDLVTLHVAPSAHIARMIVNLLIEAGIPAWVEGAALADEGAVAQMALGVIGRDIQVARDTLAEAQEVLAAMKEAGAAMSEDEPDEA